MSSDTKTDNSWTVCRGRLASISMARAARQTKGRQKPRLRKLVRRAADN